MLATEPAHTPVSFIISEYQKRGDFLFGLSFEDGKLMVHLCEEIDHHSVSSMRSRIDLEIKQNIPSEVILDFGDVSFMDSSGIGLIMGRCRIMNEIGGVVKIKDASEQIRKIFRLSGIDRITKEY